MLFRITATFTWISGNIIQDYVGKLVNSCHLHISPNLLIISEQKSLLKQLKFHTALEITSQKLVNQSDEKYLNSEKNTRLF